MSTKDTPFLDPDTLPTKARHLSKKRASPCSPTPISDNEAQNETKRETLKKKQKRTKVSKKKCAKCSKKLPLPSRFSCKCEKTFCAAHRLSFNHDCTYDFKKEYVKPEAIRGEKLEKL